MYCRMASFETFRLSFTNASIAGEEYVGFENYEKLLASSKFSKIAIRTFVWTFFSVLLKLILGMIGAVLLNASLRGRTFFRIFSFTSMGSSNCYRCSWMDVGL